MKVKSYHGNQKNMLVATHIPIFKFVAVSMSEILLQPETLTKMLTDRQTDRQTGNRKVKVKSYHGNQKNMLVATHRPIFKFVALSMSEILLNQKL